MTGPARRVIPDLPRPARLVLAADALSAVGSGLTLPFLLIYLSQVRHIDLTVAGLAAAMIPLASLVGNPIGGWLSDRYGARNTLIAGIVLSALATVALTVVDTAWRAFPVTFLLGLGASIVWPSQDSLLAVCVHAAQRSTVFAVRLATLNAGLGAGALLGTLVVNVEKPATFATSYLIDAMTFLLAIPLLALVPANRPTTTHAEPAGHETSTEKGSYREVISDRTFLRLWALTALVVTISYGQYHSGFPAYAARPDGIAASRLGLAFAANTITVVVAQLVVLRVISGRTRTTTLAAACLTWATTWAITLAAGAFGSSARAVAAFTAAMITFGVAESLLAPTIPAIVNDLAPDHLRGRYNGASALAWTCGFFTGPTLAGVALDHDHGTLLFAAVAAAAVAAAFAATRLARHLPENLNRITS